MHTALNVASQFFMSLSRFEFDFWLMLSVGLFYDFIKRNFEVDSCNSKQFKLKI